MFYTAASQTSLLIQLQDLATYHVWAVSRLADWLKTKPTALLEAEVASSFPGIKETLLHMRDVERGLLTQLQHGRPPFATRRKADDSLDEVLGSLVEEALSLEEYLQSLTEEELEEACDCNIAFIGEVCRPRYEIIQHCLNHSTYHRGQVVTIGHQLGLRDAPMTDYLFYIMRVKEPASYGLTTLAGNHNRKTTQPAYKSFLAVNFFSK